MEYKNNETSYRSGTKIRSVSKVPMWFLKLIGFFDSKRGEGVAKAHLDKLLDKCTELEALECLTAEEILKDKRQEGANALATLKNSRKNLSKEQEKISGNSPAEIREKLRREKQKESAENAICEAERQLFNINESIINIDSILSERIIKTRKKAATKIDAYIKGLRSGELKDFDTEIHFYETAIETYHNKHDKLDKAINSVATTLTDKGESI